MTKVTIDRELLPCPFCGSPAKSDNGFPPAESITYAWCSNTECQLHSVDVGMTPADWNQRALRKVNPQPPAVSATWHESPESVRRAMWEEVAVAEGMTYEQLIAESVGCGETEDGELVEFSYEQELAGMREQGCWAFVDARTNTIHAWADDATPRELVLHMLAHEIGHITGESHPDDIQEEMRAEQFGRVAKMAYALLPALATPRQPEGEGLEVVAWQDAENPLYTTAERRVLHDWANNGYPIVELCRLSDAQRAIAKLREECEHLKACQENAMLHMTGLVAERNTLRQQLAKVRDEISQHSNDLALTYMKGGADMRQQRDKLAGLLREKFPRIDHENPYPIDEVEHHCEYTLYQERERLHREIDAALAEVGK